MDFVSHLPRSTKEYASTWVILDRLTKFTHFHQSIRRSRWI